MLKRIAAVLLFCLLALPASAEDDAKKELMAIVPPTVRLLSVTPGEDAQINPEQMMTQVAPRVVKDVKGKGKWPFRMLPANTIPDIYKEVVGSERSATQDVRFGDLKKLAEKAGCRYLMLTSIKELTSSYKDDFLNSNIRARADVDVTIYDRESDAFVWQANAIKTTKHPKTAGDVGLRREQDGALNAALMVALEPFAKGDRKRVERPKVNIVASVTRVMGDGKKVLLDVGRGQNVAEGDVFKSVESDCEVKITEVLDNGSIAEVVAGTPKEKEVFKPKP